MNRMCRDFLVSYHDTSTIFAKCSVNHSWSMANCLGASRWSVTPLVVFWISNNTLSNQLVYVLFFYSILLGQVSGRSSAAFSTSCLTMNAAFSCIYAVSRLHVLSFTMTCGKKYCFVCKKSFNQTKNPNVHMPLVEHSTICVIPKYICLVQIHDAQLVKRDAESHLWFIHYTMW